MAALTLEFAKITFKTVWAGQDMVKWRSVELDIKFKISFREWLKS